MGTWGRAAAIGLCVSTAPLGLRQGGGQGPIEQLTTATPEFCQHLSTRLLQAERETAPPEPVLALAGEGRAMCDQGEIRQGVHRLRRAMHLLMEREGASWTPSGSQDGWRQPADGAGTGAGAARIIDLPPTETSRR